MTEQQTATATLEETQRDSIGGILGAFQSFIEAMGARPKRSANGMLFLWMAVILGLLWTNPEAFLTPNAAANGAGAVFA